MVFAIVLSISVFLNTDDNTNIKKIEESCPAGHVEMGEAAKSKTRQVSYSPTVLFDEAHIPMVTLNPNVDVNPATFIANANSTAVKNKILNSSNKPGQNGGYDSTGGYGFNWSGKYSSLSDVLIRDGFQIFTLDGVTTIDNNTFETQEGGSAWGDPLYPSVGSSIIESNLIKYDGTPAYDLLVIPGSRGKYTDEELNIIQKYVRSAGGSIFVISEFYQIPGGYYSPGAEQILEMFGIKIRGTIYDEVATHQANSSFGGGGSYLDFENDAMNQNHLITKNIATLEYYKGGYFGHDALDTTDPTTYPADAIPLVKPYSTAKDARDIFSPSSEYASLPSDAAVALAISSGKTTGKGRMVAVGDTDIFSTWNQLTNHNNGDIDHDGRPDFNDTDNDNDIFALNIFNWLTRYHDFDMYFPGDDKYVLAVEAGADQGTIRYGVSVERRGHYFGESHVVDISAISYPNIYGAEIAPWEWSVDRVSSVELFDTTKSVYLVVSMPTNITASQQVTIFLNGTSRNDPTVKHSIRLELSIVVRYGMKFENSTYRRDDAIMGRRENFTVNISNVGNIADIYDLTPILNSNLSNDWNASGWSVAKNVTITPQRLPIGRGESKITTISIAIPKNVTGDSYISLRLKVTSPFSNFIYDSAEISVIVKKIRIIEVSNIKCDLDIIPDLNNPQTMFARFVLKNNGNVDENVTCIIDSDYWNIGLIKDEGGLTSALNVYLVKYSGTKTCSVNVTVPPDMPAGTYEFYIKIGVDNVTVTGDIVNITTEGQKVPAVKVSTTIEKACAIDLKKLGDEIFIWDLKNSSIIANVVLINNGNTVDDVIIDISKVTIYEDGTEVPGFTLVSNRNVPLNLSERKNYTIALTIPTDLPHVLYKIIVVATSSDLTISKTLELSFNNEMPIKYVIKVTNIDFSFKDIRDGDVVDVIVSVTDLSDATISNASVTLDIDGTKYAPLSIPLKGKNGTAKFRWTASIGNHTLTAVATIEKDSNLITDEKITYREVKEKAKPPLPPQPFIIPSFEISIVLSVFTIILALFSHRRLKRHY